MKHSMTLNRTDVVIVIVQTLSARSLLLFLSKVLKNCNFYRITCDEDEDVLNGQIRKKKFGMTLQFSRCFIYI